MLEQFIPGRRVPQIVEGLARHFAKEHGLQHLGQNDLFETFSAFCIVRRFHSSFAPDELRCGGSSDLGIDAYAVIIDNEVFTDPDEVRDFIAGRRQIQVRFVVIQAKRRRAFDGATFEKLADGINHLFSHEKLGIAAGRGVSRLRQCVRIIYDDTEKFEVHGQPRLDVWYTSLGKYSAAAHQGRREAAYRKLDDSKMFRLVEITGAGAAELRNAYRDTSRAAAAKLKLPANRRLELPSMPGVGQAFVGVIRARDLVDGLLVDEHGDRRPHLYDENVRDFLGTVVNPVNSEIASTLDDAARSRQFAVLNNGVTIVVNSLVASATDILLRGPRVVNGCQTCNVLVANRKTLSDEVMVNVRIVHPRTEQVVDSIVRATNRQTEISSDVLTARSPIQQAVEEFCASREEGREVYFERRLQQFGVARPSARIINRRHLVQAYAAMWMDCPEKVFRYHNLSSGKSGAIFGDDHDALFYYLAASSYLGLNRLIGRGVPTQYRGARFLLLYGLKLLRFGPGRVQLTGDALEKTADKMLDTVWEPSELHAVMESLLKVIDGLLSSDGGLNRLNSAVRDEGFADRFRRAVLDLPGPDGQR